MATKYIFVTGGSLRAGILAALIFPALMLVCLLGMRKTQ